MELPIWLLICWLFITSVAIWRWAAMAHELREIGKIIDAWEPGRGLRGNNQ